MEYNSKRRKIVYFKACLIGALSCALIMTGCSGHCPEGPSGHGEGVVFEFYDGPVFPLTFKEDEDAVTVSRNVDYNFSKYSEEYGSGSTVTDSYELYNESKDDLTVTAVYPFVGSFNLLDWPVITVNQSEADYEIHAGAYAGGFTGGGGDSVSLNLQNYRSWEEYAEMLSDGSYFSDAFSSPQNLNQPVVVYKVHDIVNQHEDARSAVLSMILDYDSAETDIFTFGFNGGGIQESDGGAEGNELEYRLFFVNEWPNRPDWKVKYLIAAGEDLRRYELQGYRDGSCTPGAELDGISASVTRVETTLGDALKVISKLRYDAVVGDASRGTSDRYINEKISFLQYYEQIVRHFMENGSMGAEPKERYTSAWNGSFDAFVDETMSLTRIMYLTFDIIIPAGESVTVSAEQFKDGSHDYYYGSAEGDGANLDGYDMMVSLGSNLSFRNLSASISGYDAVEIIRQNFGFDIAAGITEVNMDLNEPRYYLEVRSVIPAARR